MGRQLQGIFPVPSAMIFPPYTPFRGEGGSCQGIPVVISLPSAAGGQQLKAVRGGDSALPLDEGSSLAGSGAATSLARSGPSGVLLQEDTLATRGGSPPRQETLR